MPLLRFGATYIMQCGAATRLEYYTPGAHTRRRSRAACRFLKTPRLLTRSFNVRRLSAPAGHSRRGHAIGRHDL